MQQETNIISLAAFLSESNSDTQRIQNTETHHEIEFAVSALGLTNEQLCNISSEVTTELQASA